MRTPRFLIFAAVLGAPFALAQRSDVVVPPELSNWQGWVLHDKEYRRCPFLHDSPAAKPEHFVCLWPGALQIRVDAQGGRFEQTWQVRGGAQWVPLPGSGDTWPRAVTVDGRAASVVLREDAPSVHLRAGTRRVAGEFGWQERPATLRVPVGSGLVALAVDGERVTLPRLEANSLWLGRGEQGEAAQDGLQSRVYRRVQDDVPTMLETVLRLDVSGSVREESIGPMLPDGFIPLALASDLPARLAEGGHLRVQLRPGRWEIRIDARAADVLAAIASTAPLSNLPDEEIWSFEANPGLRATGAEAARPVAPQVVGSPWPDLPTFHMRPGETLAIVEKRRGQGETDNALTVARQLWLDFDGAGFTFVDDVTGEMRTGFRLGMTPPYSLQAAADQGESLLVTGDGEERGVEVTGPQLTLEALGRIETRGGTPVVGWGTSIDDMTATLNLPPGRKLLTALGVDNAPRSWTGRWRLLDFFVLLIVTGAMARLFGRAAAAVALVALGLSFHEPGAPVWTWLNLLAATALVRVAPDGWLAKTARSYRVVSLAMLLLFLVPFVLGQIRIAIYPQLESEAQRHGHTIGLFEVLAGAGGFRPLHSGLPATLEVVRERIAEPVQQGYFRVAPADPGAKYMDDALVQTGPGKPDWEWTPYDLVWSGPVDATRTMRLVVLPPWLVSALRFLAVLALGVFAARFAFEALGRPWRWPTLPKRAATVVAAGLCVALVGQSALANTPAPQLLEELERRLLAPPECAPACAEIVRAEVTAGADAVSIELEIHALADVAVPVPGVADGWRPQRIELGGEPRPALWDDDGALRTLVAAGRHTLTLEGALPAADSVEIRFSKPPRVAQAQSDHWLVGGIEDGVLVADALTLTRLRANATGAATPTAATPDWEPTRFPIFAHVDRTVLFNREWRVRTVVRRLAPRLGAINIEVPLVDGESVVTAERTVANGRVDVALSPHQDVFLWDSTLPQRGTFTLVAPADSPWREVWAFRVDPMWRIEFAGVPQSQPGERRSGRHPIFHPRPGETLTVTIQRPGAAPGGTLAFDEVRLQTDVGVHSRKSTLRTAYRSTRGGSETLGLPQGAALEFVTIDDQREPLALTNGELNLPVLPGEHTVTVAWNESASAGVRARTPEVTLPGPAANLRTGVLMPSSRWVLYATGPTLGPAVLYWAELIALVVAALVLGRLTSTPLNTGHWLLLGLGFSTFSWLAFAVVAAWLIAHGVWQKELGRRWHNARQIALGVLTLAAFAAILTGIPNGLLGTPDMTITGYQSAGHMLTWFGDQTSGDVPVGTVWSVPLWIYKTLILAWSLWLSFALLRWLPWIWKRFSERGLWLPPDPGRKKPKSKPSGERKDDAWSAGTASETP